MLHDIFAQALRPYAPEAPIDPPDPIEIDYGGIEQDFFEQLMNSLKAGSAFIYEGKPQDVGQDIIDRLLPEEAVAVFRARLTTGAHPWIVADAAICRVVREMAGWYARDSIDKGRTE